MSEVLLPFKLRLEKEQHKNYDKVQSVSVELTDRKAKSVKNMLVLIEMTNAWRKQAFLIYVFKNYK